jgi:prepilin-type processing-associated H-X9-DG protein
MRAALWLSLVSLAVTTIAQGQFDVTKDALPLEKDALVLLPPDEVATSETDATWSTDGRYLLVVGDQVGATTPDFETMFGDSNSQVAPISTARRQVIVYSAVTGKTRVLANLTDDQAVEEAHWLGDSSSFLLVIRTVSQSQESPGQLVATRTINVVSASNGFSGPIDPASTGTTPQLFYSPTRTLAALFVYPSEKQGETEIRFINAHGLLPQKVFVPAKLGVVNWSNSGSTPYFAGMVKKPVGGWDRVMYRIDDQSGQIEKVTEMKGDPNPKTEPAVMQSSQVPTKAGELMTKANMVWLKSVPADAHVVVTTDGEQAQFSPRETAVSYVSHGALLVRRIAHLPLDAYERVLKQAKKVAALNTAKQVALAILMYSADDDNRYPSNTGNWQSLLGPYANNPDMVNQFNYTFAGGPSSGIDSPATQQIGYVDGPDGRAVAYADGHVKWIPNQ